MIAMNDRTKKFMVGGGVLAAAAIAAPVIWAGVSGLIGLVTAATIAGASVSLAPVVAAFLANAKLKGVKLIAAANPIEELQNDYMRQNTELTKFAQAITDAASEAHLFDTKMAQLAVQYPAEAAQFRAQSEGMHTLIAKRRQHYELAKLALEDYQAEIKKASAVYDMALASERLNKAAGKLGGDPMATIRKETAIDSIQRKVSRSFAELQQAMMEEGVSPLLKPALATPAPLATASAATSPQSQLALPNNPQPVVLQGTPSASGRVRPMSRN